MGFKKKSPSHPLTRIDTILQLYDTAIAITKKEKKMVNFDLIAKEDPQIADLMKLELKRQQQHLELIASENMVSDAVMEAMGSHGTNKYAKGYPTSTPAPSATATKKVTAYNSLLFFIYSPPRIVLKVMCVSGLSVTRYAF